MLLSIHTKGLEACGREVLVPEELIIFHVPEIQDSPSKFRV